MSRLILFSALLLIGSSSIAQQQVPEVDATSDEATRRLDQIEQEAAALIANSPHTNEEAQDYNRWTLSYRKEAYAWHQTSTIIIFVIVNIIVLAGLVLAGWQLSAWISRVKKYDEVLIKMLATGTDVDHELVKGLGQAGGGTVDLKSKALAVSSPYVGVIILGLSMGFFLAYLLLVYPVTPGP
jgi:hypothetical protein